MSDAEANTAMKGVMASIEKACSDKGNASPVSAQHQDAVRRRHLYAGGKYHLYTYDKYTRRPPRVRPEEAIGFFRRRPR